MGLLIGIIQRKVLKQEQSRYQFQLLTITKGLSVAHRSCENLTQTGTNYQADPVMTKILNERLAKLKALEDQLREQKEEITTRLDEIKTELQSVNAMIKEGVQEMFSYSAA